MAYVHRTKIERVAEQLSELTWRDMQEVAETLADRINNVSTEQKVTTENAAYVLNDWACAVNDTYEARCDEEKA